MSNLRLEDLMNLVAAMGTVQLRRTRFPGAGTPGLVGRPVRWEAELLVPGYRDAYGQPTMRAQGLDPLSVMQDLYDKAETYFASDESRADRARYEANYAREVAHWESLNDSNKRWGSRPRGAPYPDVRGPDAPSVEDEVFLRS